MVSPNLLQSITFSRQSRLMSTSVPERITSTAISKTQFAFVLIISLIFLFGFLNNLNPILIPHLQKAFTLSTTHSIRVDPAVYKADLVIALPAGYIIRRMGYKVGIITGLILVSMGAFLCIPAVHVQSYVFFLFALFVRAWIGSSHCSGCGSGVYTFKRDQRGTAESNVIGSN